MKAPVRDVRIPHNEETLRSILRGEAQVHVAQIDRRIPLSSDRLLRLAWSASELAAMVELRG